MYEKLFVFTELVWAIVGAVLAFWLMFGMVLALEEKRMSGSKPNATSSLVEHAASTVEQDRARDSASQTKGEFSVLRARDENGSSPEKLFLTAKKGGHPLPDSWGGHSGAPKPAGKPPEPFSSVDKPENTKSQASIASQGKMTTKSRNRTVSPGQGEAEIKDAQPILLKSRTSSVSPTSDDSKGRQISKKKFPVRCSSQAIELLKRLEGFRSRSYQCVRGTPTIGYGTTRGADGRPISRDHAPITREEGELFLLRDLFYLEKALARMVKIPLAQHRWDSLCLLVYNIGPTQFGASTLLRHLNRGNMEAAARQFPRWRFAGGQSVAGLVNRRKIEMNMFNGRGGHGEG